MTEIPDLTNGGQGIATVEVDEDDTLIMPEVANLPQELEVKKVYGEYVVIGHVTSNAEAGFDSTHFYSAENFVEVLEEIGFDAYMDYARVNTARWDTTKDSYHHTWSNEDGVILCGHNPILGKMAEFSPTPSEEGYAGYIGIEGKSSFVQRATDIIRNNQQVSIKDYDQYSRSFI